MRRGFPIGPAVMILGLLLQPAAISAKQKTQPLDPNDPTYRLFQMLDSSYAGKLADFYLLGPLKADPQNPGEQMQQVLRVDYDKSRGFGKLNIYVRLVGKMDSEQLKTYTAKQIYGYGVADGQKFVKTEPGPFGKPGDVYLRSSGEGPLATAAITQEIRKEYEDLLNSYMVPSLSRK